MPDRLTLATLAIAISGAPVSAQEIHAPHCLFGCPEGSPGTNDLVIREIYILSSNDETKFADWAAYKISEETIGSTAERNWKSDPALADEETLEPKDYKGAWAELKIDRGHQVPLASFTSTRYWETTNYLSNITPQKSTLNQGPWVDLETVIRALAKSSSVDAVFVMTGPLYERDMPSMPGADEHHKIPSGYWKIISIQDSEEIRSAAFMFDQETSRKADYCSEDFVASIRTVEQRSGLNFFHGLSANKQDALETQPSKLRSELGCNP
ncbi:MAG: DNA/RNA non-specific endonuclease [Rhodospirillales bacterium]|nr:DNA/RNA non-specific endonuclease [Rhodospirillales bacterium]